MSEIEKMDLETANRVDERIERMRELSPRCSPREASTSTG